MAPTIRLKLDELNEHCAGAGLDTQREIAAAMGVRETTVYRALEGRTGPGEKFIAGILTALHPLKFEALFDIVDDTAA